MLNLFTTEIENTPVGPAGMPSALSAPEALCLNDSAEITEPLLIRQAQEGDSEAFEQLVREYHPALLRLALHLTGSDHDAQDVCQEAFLSAYQNLANFRFECSFYTWIYRIVTNRCLDYLRRRQNLREFTSISVSLEGREAELVDRVPDSRHATNPESGLVAWELRTCIARALEKLSPRERKVFELKHYGDLKLRAVADLLNTTEGNARHALFRATRKLRIALAGVR